MAGGGWTQLVGAHIRLGRLDELATLSAEMQEITDGTGDRLVQGLVGMANISEALLRGQFEDARIATDEILAAGAMWPSSSFVWAVLTMARLFHAGQADEARPIAELLDAAPASTTGWPSPRLR